MSWIDELRTGNPSREAARRAYAFVSNARGVSNTIEHLYGWKLFENIEHPPYSKPDGYPGPIRRAVGHFLVRLGMRLNGMAD